MTPVEGAGHHAADPWASPPGRADLQRTESRHAGAPATSRAPACRCRFEAGDVFESVPAGDRQPFGKGMFGGGPL